MKKLLILIPFVVAGCSTTVFTMTKSDGTKVSASNNRLFWTTDTIDAEFTTNGASLKTTKSSTDGTTIAAIVQGAVAGTVQGVK